MDEVANTGFSAGPPLPLHRAALDPDEAWGSKQTTKCICGRTHSLWIKKCPGCNQVNHFPRLVKKRERIKKWIDKSIQYKISPKMDQSQFLLDAMKRYDRVLTETVRQPFPSRRKNEDINLYMKRVTSYFPSMFKTTSPKKMAAGLFDVAKRSSATIARLAWAECERIVNEATSHSKPSLQGQLLEQQAERVFDDLMNLSKPYMEALKTLQLTHSRLVTAYTPVQKIFKRHHAVGGRKALWNKARSMVHPVGNIIRLPTAVWKDAQEQQELKRLDQALSKFIEQCKWFQAQTSKLTERDAVLQNTYKLSMRRHVICTLVHRAKQVNLVERRALVRCILSQKGVSWFLWRWFFGASTK